MKKEVVHYECDNCGSESEPEEMDKKNPLPEGWIDLSASTNHGQIFDLQLCEACEGAIKKALSRRRKK